MKKKIWKRILSMMLAVVLFSVTFTPVFETKVHAAVTNINFNNVTIKAPSKVQKIASGFTIGYYVIRGIGGSIAAMEAYKDTHSVGNAFRAFIYGCLGNEYDPEEQLPVEQPHDFYRDELIAIQNKP